MTYLLSVPYPGGKKSFRHNGGPKRVQLLSPVGLPCTILLELSAIVSIYRKITSYRIYRQECFGPAGVRKRRAALSNRGITFENRLNRSGGNVVKYERGRQRFIFTSLYVFFFFFCFFFFRPTGRSRRRRRTTRGDDSVTEDFTPSGPLLCVAYTVVDTDGTIRLIGRTKRLNWQLGRQVGVLKLSRDEYHSEMSLRPGE